jgi:hypothetical protein
MDIDKIMIAAFSGWHVLSPKGRLQYIAEVVSALSAQYEEEYKAYQTKGEK